MEKNPSCDASAYVFHITCESTLAAAGEAVTDAKTDGKYIMMFSYRVGALVHYTSRNKLKNQWKSGDNPDHLLGSITYYEKSERAWLSLHVGTVLMHSSQAGAP